MVLGKIIESTPPPPTSHPLPPFWVAFQRPCHVVCLRLAKPSNKLDQTFRDNSVSAVVGLFSQKYAPMDHVGGHFHIRLFVTHYSQTPGPSQPLDQHLKKPYELLVGGCRAVFWPDKNRIIPLPSSVHLWKNFQIIKKNMCQAKPLDQITKLQGMLDMCHRWFPDKKIWGMPSGCILMYVSSKSPDQIGQNFQG